MGKIYVKSENILTSIYVHIGVNASSVVFDTVPENAQKWLLFVTAVLTGAYIIQQIISKKNNNSKASFSRLRLN